MRRQFMTILTKENQLLIWREEKKFIPPLLERILTAKSIEFSAETKFSGIEFVPLKESKLTKEQQEEIESFKNPRVITIVVPSSDKSAGKFTICS